MKTFRLTFPFKEGFRHPVASNSRVIHNSTLRGKCSDGIGLAVKHVRVRKAQEKSDALISIGNVILNLDRVSVLDIDDREPDAVVLLVRTDSSEPIIKISLAPQVPDLLLNMVPQKVRFLGYEAAP